MAEMRWIPRRDVGAEAWDRLVDGSPDGWVFATWSWQEAIVAVPMWQLEEHGFAAEHAGELIAVLPLHLIAAERRLSSSGWGGAGPVLAGGLPPGTERAARSFVHQRLLDLATELGAQTVTMAISPVTRRSLANRWGINPLIFEGFADRSTHSRVIDLSGSEEALWAGLSQSARQAIKAARRAGYSADRGSWPDWLDRYYEVHCETYRRTGVTPHPREYFAGIATRTAADGHAVLWAGHAPDGQAVAFHNQARFAGSAAYHTGCSTTEHLRSGINYLLLWESILGAKRDGCGWFEVGEVFPGVRAGKEHGLSIMKSKFGGEIHRVFRGELGIRAVRDDAQPPLEAPGQAAPEASTEPSNGSCHLTADPYTPTLATRLRRWRDRLLPGA